MYPLKSQCHKTMKLITCRIVGGDKHCRVSLIRQFSVFTKIKGFFKKSDDRNNTQSQDIQGMFSFDAAELKVVMSSLVYRPIITGIGATSVTTLSLIAFWNVTHPSVPLYVTGPVAILTSTPTIYPMGLYLGLWSGVKSLLVERKWILKIVPGSKIEKLLEAHADSNLKVSSTDEKRFATDLTAKIQNSAKALPSSIARRMWSRVVQQVLPFQYFIELPSRITDEMSRQQEASKSLSRGDGATTVSIRTVAEGVILSSVDDVIGDVRSKAWKYGIGSLLVISFFSDAAIMLMGEKMFTV